ncbi:MAG: NHLP family bacteriocin export ABC transporter peptidase/permease/ATPase subunit [Acidobacteriota bacterium]
MSDAATLERAAPPRVRTPTRLQMEAVECGAASLAMILEHHGKHVPLTELRRDCGVARDGSRASNLLKAARRHGLEAAGYKKELELVRALAPPYVVFWNFKHFLVVEGFGDDVVYLNDPASGHRVVSLEEFDEAYTGVVLTFEPGEDFEPGGERPSLVRAVVDRLQGSQRALLYCLLAGLMLALPGLLLPAFSKIFVDRVLMEERVDWVRPLLLAMGLAVGLQAGVQALQLQVMRRLKVRLSVRLASRYLWHLLRLPMSFYAQRYSGEVASRASLNERLAELLSGRLTGTVIDLVTMTLYAGLMFWYDAVLTLVGLGCAAGNVVALHLLRRRRVEANLRMRQALGKVSGESIALLHRMETIKASGRESESFARWSGLYVRAANTTAELAASSQSLSVLPTFLTQLATVLILIVGGWRVIQGDVTVGTLVALQALMVSFLRPVGDLVELGGTIQELEGDLARLDDVLAHDALAESAGPTGRTLSGTRRSDGRVLELDGSVELRDVTFGYNPLDLPFLSDFSLAIEPGQRVALVGGSGSGKTTVAGLVGDLHRPWSGEILFDGRARAELSPAALTGSLALVSQEIFLFAGTVRDNLTLWDATIPDEELLRACADAEILDTVLGLPGGLDGVLLEGGANLSGGQRQRLELARALVGSPSLLVLDEATSALDAETEEAIDRNLRMRGCTCLIVAHRLSTIRDCDRILVMERGRVVEQGTHDELWSRSGAYAALLRAGGDTVGA